MKKAPRGSVRVPIVGRDGVVQRRIIRKAILAKYYGVTQVNNRRKKAYIRKESEERAAEIVRGSGRSLRRVRILIRTKYDPRPGKDRKATKVEVSVRAVVPYGIVTEFRDFVRGLVEQYTPGDWDLGTEGDSDAAPGSRVGVEAVEVIIRGAQNAAATAALENYVSDWLRPHEGASGEPMEGEAASIMRAVHRTDRRGRGYWMDPVTGKRSLPPPGR